MEVDPALAASLSAEKNLPLETVEEVIRHFNDVSVFILKHGAKCKFKNVLT